jgi:hypothetical protein
MYLVKANVSDPNQDASFIYVSNDTTAGAVPTFTTSQREAFRFPSRDVAIALPGFRAVKLKPRS